MENKVKRIGYLPRKRVLEIIDEISKSESISRSKVVGILVEEALDARGIANFGYSNISNSNIYKLDNFKDLQNDNADSFAMSFDEEWENIDCDDIRLKIDKVFELLSDHPFLISNPENARKMAEFRIFSLKKFQ